MLSLRCRINANVAELLVIIGYSELGPTLGARPFALRRSLGRLPACLSACLCLPVPASLSSSPARSPWPFASSPVWSFPRLPRCRGTHWRASRWTALRATSQPLSIHTIRTAIRDQLERIFGCLCSTVERLNGTLYLSRLPSYPLCTFVTLSYANPDFSDRFYNLSNNSFSFLLTGEVERTGGCQVFHFSSSRFLSRVRLLGDLNKLLLFYFRTIIGIVRETIELGSSE